MENKFCRSLGIIFLELSIGLELFLMSPERSIVQSLIIHRLHKHFAKVIKIEVMQKIKFIIHKFI